MNQNCFGLCMNILSVTHIDYVLCRFSSTGLSVVTQTDTLCIVEYYASFVYSVISCLALCSLVIHHSNPISNYLSLHVQDIFATSFVIWIYKIGMTGLPQGYQLPSSILVDPVPLIQIFIFCLWDASILLCLQRTWHLATYSQLVLATVTGSRLLLDMLSW